MSTQKAASDPEPTGEATFMHFGFLVLNTTNGKLESFQGPLIIPGCSSGNIKSMTTALAQVGLAFAQKSELSTDPTSPDDTD